MTRGGERYRHHVPTSRRLCVRPRRCPLVTAVHGSGRHYILGRWANLHRPTDPIGGPLLPSIDVEVSEPVDRVAFIDGETKETLLIVFVGWLNRIRGMSPPEVVQVYRMHSKYEPIESFVEARTRIEDLLPMTSADDRYPDLPTTFSHCTFPSPGIPDVRDEVVVVTTGTGKGPG